MNSVLKAMPVFAALRAAHLYANSYNGTDALVFPALAERDERTKLRIYSLFFHGLKVIYHGPANLQFTYKNKLSEAEAQTKPFPHETHISTTWFVAVLFSSIFFFCSGYFFWHNIDGCKCNREQIFLQMDFFRIRIA